MQLPQIPTGPAAPVAWDPDDHIWQVVATGTTFPLLAPDGSAAAPPYSFASNPAQGMYHNPAGPYIGISKAGADVIQFFAGQIRAVSNLVFSPDATYNIGGSVSTLRPNNIYVANQLNSGNYVIVGSNTGFAGILRILGPDTNTLGYAPLFQWGIDRFAYDGNYGLFLTDLNVGSNSVILGVKGGSTSGYSRFTVFGSSDVLNSQYMMLTSSGEIATRFIGASSQPNLTFRVGNSQMMVLAPTAVSIGPSLPFTLASFGGSPASLLSGSGVPSAANGTNGDYYFRYDTPAVANQRLYVKSAGAWVAIL